MSTLALSAFEELLLNFFGCFTEPSAQNFKTLAKGWVLSPGRKTMTNVIRAAGAEKHHSVYYRFLSRAVWEMEELEEVLLREVVKEFGGGGGPLYTAGDDTLYPKSGKKVPGADIFRDPVLSSRSRPVFRRGQNWVGTGLVTRPEFLRGGTLYVPLAVRLCQKRQKQKESETRSHLMVKMVGKIAAGVEGRRVYHCVDGAYSNEIVVSGLPANCELIGRIRCDAAIYEAPPERVRGQAGRPRKKGERLPNPQEIAEDPRWQWREVRVKTYGKKRRLLVKQIKALWYRVSKERLMNIVVVRDPKSRAKDQFFFSTDTSLAARQVIKIFAGRWSAEVSHRDSKQVFRVSEVQSWSSKGGLRAIPVGLLLQAIVLLWYSRYGHGSRYDVGDRGAWYVQKKAPSSADMLACLRRAIWDAEVFGNSSCELRCGKLLERLLQLLCAA
jgi:hypothetical protein